MTGFLRKALWAAPIVAVAILLNPAEADACGGCFVPPEENTQVTGHRMIMSISMAQSTLYDQIEYTGSPESFAWVLPTRGKVDVGLSSDLIFNQLGFDTAVQVLPPPLNCPSYNCGYDDGDSFGSTATSGAPNDAGGGEVNVIAQEVVGPYETVQLESSSPTALQDWLAAHGFNVPADIQPIVASYVAEKFNFLAMKLVPGKDVTAITPVRVTTQGANVALPLRMVAAGTGAKTAMTLWVIANGKYETANFPSFTLPANAHVWDYDQQSSNRAELMDLAYKATNNFGWLTEASFTYSEAGFRGTIMNVVEFASPEQNGYSLDQEEAYKLAQEDLEVLFAGMGSNVWVTRLRGELGRPALGSDLQLAASTNQTPIERIIQTTKFVGTQPACPPAPPGCDPVDGNSSSEKEPWGETASAGSGASCSFAAPPTELGAGAAGSLLLLLLGLHRRRRKNTFLSP